MRLLALTIAPVRLIDRLTTLLLLHTYKILLALNRLHGLTLCGFPEGTDG